MTVEPSYRMICDSDEMAHTLNCLALDTRLQAIADAWNEFQSFDGLIEGVPAKGIAWANVRILLDALTEEDERISIV